jgi:superfamily II DNA or RNA helicase
MGGKGVIELKDYQLEALEAVYAEWDSGNRRAVVSLPPGTGKFFIEAAVAEREAPTPVLAVAPSRAILEQQARNLARLYPTADVSNLEATTYAQLAADVEAGRELPTAGIVLLDEVHRAGAASWMPAVEALIGAQPEQPRILGLSATCVRHSKGATEERDMSIAISGRAPVYSMTLAAALSHGILARPRYVSMIYRWDEVERSVERDIECACDYRKDELESRYRHAKEAIGESDTVADVVGRYLPRDARKVIVFCRDGEGAAEARANVAAWFPGRSARAFTMLYEDGRALEALKSFEGERHDGLKVLVCVDMLNEGVHVDAVDAVMFLRPSSSPIIYTQQLGRALDSGAKSSPVIFDLVNNLSAMGGLRGALGGEPPVEAAKGGGAKAPEGDWLDELVDYEPVGTDLQKALEEISAMARASIGESIRRCREEHPDWTYEQIAAACGTVKSNVSYALSMLDDGASTASETRRSEREALIGRYAAENPYFSWKRMSEELDIPLATCKRIAKKLGLAPRKPRSTREELRRIAEAGPLPTAAECARLLGVSEAAVRTAARKEGLSFEAVIAGRVEMRRREVWIQERRGLIESGEIGYEDIAVELGIKPAAARELCRKLGICGRAGERARRRRRSNAR